MNAPKMNELHKCLSRPMPAVPAFELLALAQCRGGFTYGCRTMAVYGKQPGCRPLSGWAVAVAGRECRLQMPDRDSAMYEPRKAAVERLIEGYVLANADLLGDMDYQCFLGGWVNEGCLVLDCVVVVASRNEAMELGRGWKQAEVYDFENDKSVPVEPEQVNPPYVEPFTL